MRSDRRLAWMLLLTLVFPSIYFATVDLLSVMPGSASFASRLIGRTVGLALPLVGLWMIRRARTRAALSRTTFLLALASVPLVITLQLQQPNGSSLTLAAVLMLLGVMYGGLPNSLGRQIAPPLLLSVFEIAARIWWLNGHSEGGLWSDIVVIVFFNILGVVSVQRRIALQERVAEAWHLEAEAREREWLAERRADRAVQDLRALHGIIPICASCKQVRTGAGEWQQIERYVRDHSDANFSHGVCPACAQKLYGEYLTEEPVGSRGTNG